MSLARRGGAQSTAPTSTGSLASSTPNASRTPSLISLARASRLAAVAPPGLTRASVCLDEMRAPGARGRVTLPEAGLLDEPGGRHLDPAVARGIAGDADARAHDGARRALDRREAARGRGPG